MSQRLFWCKRRISINIWLILLQLIFSGKSLLWEPFQSTSPKVLKKYFNWKHDFRGRSTKDNKENWNAKRLSWKWRAALNKKEHINGGRLRFTAAVCHMFWSVPDQNFINFRSSRFVYQCFWATYALKVRSGTLVTSVSGSLFLLLQICSFLSSCNWHSGWHAASRPDILRIQSYTIRFQ